MNLDVMKLADWADDYADTKIDQPGEYHPDWHNIRDKYFASLVLQEAACICDELAELSRTNETDSMWQHGECASAIRVVADNLRP